MAPYKFCPICTAKLRLISRMPETFECRRCGFHLYHNPKFSASVILENPKGEILLAKRKYPPHENSWNTPGGFINSNERAEAAAKREIREEAGISVSKFQYIGTYTDTYDYQGIRYSLLAIAFSGRTKSKNIRAGDDASEVRFFPKNKIPWKKIRFRSDRAALRDYIKRNKNSLISAAPVV